MIIKKKLDEPVPFVSTLASNTMDKPKPSPFASRSCGYLKKCKRPRTASSDSLHSIDKKEENVLGNRSLGSYTDYHGLKTAPYGGVPLPIIMSQTVRREANNQGENNRSGDNNRNNRKRPRQMDLSVEEKNKTAKGYENKTDNLFARLCSHPVSFHDLPHPSKLRKCDPIEAMNQKNSDVERHLREVRSKTLKCLPRYGQSSRVSCQSVPTRQSQSVIRLCSDTQMSGPSTCTHHVHSLSYRLPGSVSGSCVIRRPENLLSSAQNGSYNSDNKHLSLGHLDSFDQASELNHLWMRQNKHNLLKQFSDEKSLDLQTYHSTRSDNLTGNFVGDCAFRNCGAVHSSNLFSSSVNPWSQTECTSNAMVDGLTDDYRLPNFERQSSHLFYFEKQVPSVLSRISKLAAEHDELESHLQPFNESFQCFRKVSATTGELFQDSHIQVLRPRDKSLHVPSLNEAVDYREMSQSLHITSPITEPENSLCTTNTSHIPSDAQGSMWSCEQSDHFTPFEPLTTSSPIEDTDSRPSVWSTQHLVRDTYTPVLSPIKEHRHSFLIGPSKEE